MKKHPDSLNESLNRSWKEIGDAWKRARQESSESRIHDLRVSIRRMVSLLELIESAAGDLGGAGLKRRFKRMMKRFGPLHDVQVQLGATLQLDDVKATKGFQKFLKKECRKESAGVEGLLSPDRRARLARRVKKLDVRLSERLRATPDPSLRQSLVQEVIRSYDRFAELRSRLVPKDAESLHRLRIALKKFRYAASAAMPVIGGFSQSDLDNLGDLQRKLGNARDLQNLESRIGKWSARRPRVQDRVGAVRTRLKRQYSSRLRLLSASSQLRNVGLPAAWRKSKERTVPVAAERTIVAARVS